MRRICQVCGYADEVINKMIECTIKITYANKTEIIKVPDSLVNYDDFDGWAISDLHLQDVVFNLMRKSGRNLNKVTCIEARFTIK